MDRLPFSPYDFFGYLASGLLLVVGMDLIFGFPPVLGRNFTVVESAILLLVVYVAGQMIATPAKAFLEDLLVARILRRPNINLLERKKPWLRGLIFPGYYQPLSEQAQKRVLTRAESEGIEGIGEDLFLHVRYNPQVLENVKLMDRMNGFLNQYGLHRNLSFTALLLGAALLLKFKLTSEVNPELAKYAAASLGAGVLLFYRYLKFFRQYSYELFNTYGRAE